MVGVHEKLSLSVSTAGQSTLVGSLGHAAPPAALAHQRQQRGLVVALAHVVLERVLAEVPAFEARRPLRARPGAAGPVVVRSRRLVGALGLALVAELGEHALLLALVEPLESLLVLVDLDGDLHHAPVLGVFFGLGGLLVGRPALDGGGLVRDDLAGAGLFLLGLVDKAQVVLAGAFLG